MNRLFFALIPLFLIMNKHWKMFGKSRDDKTIFL